MSKIDGIKAVAFDGDGTLWDFEKVMRHSLHFVFRELEQFDPLAASLLDIDKMIAIRNRVASELKGKITNLEEIRLEAFKQTLADIDRPDNALASHLNQVYLQRRFKDIELFEDVLPALETLKKKYSLGLISNGNSYPERCGLNGVFSFVIFSQNYGFEKPDPRLFHIALEKVGCSTRQLLMVGDSLQNNVIGAMEAGIKGIWLNRTQAKSEIAFNIEYEIQSMTELLDIL
ncbi:HAD family hydrolase [Chloroflexota bacterium]